MRTFVTKTVRDLCPSSKTNHLSSIHGQPLTLSKRTYFSGVFRVREISSFSDEDGKQHKVLELHACNGSVTASCEESILANGNIPNSGVAKVLVYRKNHCPDQLQIARLENCKFSPGKNPILMLPNSLCDASEWLDRLIVIRESILSPALGRFVDNIFADNEIASAFLQLPASTYHHHNEKSGLLVHSVEAAEYVARLPYDNGDLRDIAVVAALLHDVGKVRTLTSNNGHTILGKMVGHDHMTLEVCAPALKQLDQEWPDAAYTLRHVWTCASPGARYGHEANNSIVCAVRFADKYSVDCYNNRAAFQHKQVNHGMVWEDKKYLWRPAPEHLCKERSQ